MCWYVPNNMILLSISPSSSVVTVVTLYSSKNIYYSIIYIYIYTYILTINIITI